MDENLDQIRASVTNPLAPDAWWKQGDDPWQLLATCMEYIHAIDSPNPYEYMSNIPVHQVGEEGFVEHRTVRATACSITRLWGWMNWAASRSTSCRPRSRAMCTPRF